MRQNVIFPVDTPFVILYNAGNVIVFHKEDTCYEYPAV